MKPSLSPRILVAPLLALALAIAACSGDDTDTDTTPATSPTTDAQNTPTPQPTSSAPAATSTTPASAGSNDLKQALAQARSARYTASYKTSGAGFEGTMTFVQDGKKSAFKLETAGSLVVFIATESATYTCFGASAGGTCTRGEPDPSIASLALTNQLDDLEAGLESPLRIDDRKVGGLDSICWKSDDSPTAITVCVAKKESVVTLVQSNDATLELTRYSMNVDPAAFEPPFPVQ